LISLNGPAWIAVSSRLARIIQDFFLALRAASSEESTVAAVGALPFFTATLQPVICFLPQLQSLHP
jgi:hypothetical protein